MIHRRSNLAAILLAAAVAAPALAQQAGSPPANEPNAKASQPKAAAQNAPTTPAARGPAPRAPSSGRARTDPTAAASPTPPRGDALAPGSGAGVIGGGLPAMAGITPNRAELPGSAFTKLDAQKRGYLTLDDVRQLDGFESAFRQGDQNQDGQLNPSEFNSAWGIYTGNVR